MAKNLNISESTVRRSFRRLRDLGLNARVGSDKSGFWQVQ
ncbi:ArsR family transcriptional regulator [Adlercreutzia rubneri]